MGDIMLRLSPLPPLPLPLPRDLILVRVIVCAAIVIIVFMMYEMHKESLKCDGILTQYIY
jgi:hypothetical protein